MPGLVIVTGGSGGIGAAICRKLGQEGYAVAVNYAGNAGAAEAVVQEVVAAGGQARAFRGDVSNEHEVDSVFAAAQQAFGRVVGLVNSAAILSGDCRVDELTVEALQRTLAVNVVGTILPARAAVRAMSTRHGGAGGSIVNMSSVGARLGEAGELVHYATTKGAVDSFTIGLGREVAGEGIRVNAVAPGMIDTAMNPSDRQTRVAPTIPMKRVGKPAEVAEAVAWLLSPAASYATGTILTVSGGR